MNIKEIVDYIENKDLPIYDFSSNHEINKNRVKSLNLDKIFFQK